MTSTYKYMEMTEEEREQLASRLADELPVLRKQLGVSQDEMSSILGVARQTYSAIETKRRKMTWSFFLALILVFDYNEQTRDTIRNSGLFPGKILNCMDTYREEISVSKFVQLEEGQDIMDTLDAQAIHAIETVIMMEYARCNKMSGDAVIKAFDGKRFSQVTQSDIKARAALNNIKAASEKRRK